MITKSPAFNILSKKDKAIFEGLLELKHLDEESIDAILKAGELTGDTSRLSAFAISYLFLEKNNVPVRDTIVMANELGQKIYLCFVKITHGQNINWHSIHRNSSSWQYTRSNYSCGRNG